MSLKKENLAYTLAEVLITISVIAVVAMLTFPNLLSNHNDKSFEAAHKLFRQQLYNSFSFMHHNDEFFNHDTTEDFVDALSSYMKIEKVCDNTNLTKCFPQELYNSSNSVKTNTLTASNALNGKSWGTSTAGIILKNNFKILLAYDPQCAVDKSQTSGPVLAQCVSVIYDTNNKKTTRAGYNDEHGALGFINTTVLGDNLITADWPDFDIYFAYSADPTVGGFNPHNVGYYAPGSWGPVGPGSDKRPGNKDKAEPVPELPPSAAPIKIGGEEVHVTTEQPPAEELPPVTTYNPESQPGDTDHVDGANEYWYPENAWAGAVNYCKSNGMRLPTIPELQSMYQAGLLREGSYWAVTNGSGSSNNRDALMVGPNWSASGSFYIAEPSIGSRCIYP